MRLHARTGSFAPSAMMGTALSLVIFGLAIWFLTRTFQSYDFRQVMTALRALPGRDVWIALGFTGLSYLILATYDALAIHHLQHPLPYRNILFTAFVSYAFSNNIGMPVLSGGSLRYRLYSAWGLSPAQVMKIVSFCFLTYILGFFTVTGLVLLILNPALPPELPLAGFPLRLVGLLLTLVIVMYLYTGSYKQRTIRIGQWVICAPPLDKSLAQIGVACLESVVTAGILYVLLPASEVPFSFFLCAYLTAYIMGLVSNVPGGLGVFEAVLMLFLTPAIPAPALLGAVLMFRVIYYLLPLTIAVLLLGGHELHRRHRPHAYAAHKHKH